jgi:hypothetical protein
MNDLRRIRAAAALFNLQLVRLNLARTAKS